VINDEGSRSCKAIVFINSKGNIRLAKTYFEPCMSLQKKIAISAINVEFVLATERDIQSNSKIGEEL
jgi:hypothetical protein